MHAKGGAKSSPRTLSKDYPEPPYMHLEAILEQSLPEELPKM